MVSVRQQRGIMLLCFVAFVSTGVLHHSGKHYLSWNTQFMSRNKADLLEGMVFNVTENHSQIVIYNRIPKCGSRSLAAVIRNLSRLHKFNYAESSNYGHITPKFPDMMKEIHKISRLKEPALYNRHIAFLNFEKYGYRKPIFINLVRDPIERFESSYNFHKYGDLGPSKKGLERFRHLYADDINECVRMNTAACSPRNLFYTGIFFCGVELFCRRPNRTSVDLAKEHIDRDYIFIGLVEEFDNSLRLLEKILPRFFGGAVEVWSKLKSDVKNSTASHRFDELTDLTKSLLRSNLMAHEYEVYEHAKLKFEALKQKYLS